MPEEQRWRRVIWPYGPPIVFVVAIVIFLWVWVFTPITTVLLVRHAERAASPAGDPALTAAGEARAEELVHVAGVAGVTGIYASQYQRTQQTVTPLASALGLPVTVVDAADTDQLVDRILSDHGGAVVAVAGHSNTVPEIVEALGAPALCPGIIAFTPSGDCHLSESQYDNMFVVTIGWFWGRNVVRLRYGGPTP